MRWMKGFGLLVTLLVLVGCGTTAGAPQKGPNPASQPALKTTMSAGGIGGIIYLPALVADQNGFFREQGVNVEVIDFKGGADAAKALIGGSVEFASMSVEHALKAKAQGSDLVVIAGFTRMSGLTLIVDNKLKEKVKTVNDLKGLRIGVTSLGSGTHMALNALLAKVGLKQSDVEVVAVGTSTMPPALENGSIDAAINFDPFIAHVLLREKGYVLFDLATEKDTQWLYGTDYPFTALVTRREVIAQKPDLVQRMVNAIVQAQRYIQQSDAEQIYQGLPEEYRGDKAAYIHSLNHSKPTLIADGQLSEAALATVLTSLRDSGSLEATAAVDLKSVLDMSFVKKSH